MADVAERAGVSVSTVSYALSGTRPISAKTRARIVAAMKELDFTPNAFARGLKSRRSRILAFLLPTDVTATDAFTVEILFAAAERARSDGYHLLLWTESEAESLGVRDLASDGLIDGALVASIVMEDARVEALAAAGVPFVTIGRTNSCATHAFVDTDDNQTAILVMDRLAELGHASAVFIGPPASDFERGVGIALRLDESLHVAAARAGVALRSRPCEFSAAAGSDLVQAESEDGSPTAFVVMNPPALVGVLEGFERLGRVVPDDVSVVGLLTPRAAITSPVTSVVADATALGATATEIMVAGLDGRSTIHQRLIPSRLENGGSLGPAPC